MKHDGKQISNEGKDGATETKNKKNKVQRKMKRLA